MKKVMKEQSLTFDIEVKKCYNIDQFRGDTMSYQLNSVALHITDECSGKCPMCYYAKKDTVKHEGNIEILKANVREVNLVGGDPAEYSHIQELVEYLSELGLDVLILSNTHKYKNSSVEKIAPYITSLEGTFHAPTAEEHNRFNASPNSYQEMFSNLKRYDKVKTKEQKLGAVLNVMNHSYNRLYATIESLLEQGLNPDYVLIQRVGLYGRAEDKKGFSLIQERLATAFEQIDKINKELGVESVMVDAFPLCLIPEEYHKYLEKCDWGYHTASLDMNGNITRCAVANHSGENLLGNVLETPLSEIWENSPTLIKFRSKEYLDDNCKECDILEKCGGGCPTSSGDNTLSNDALVKTKK